MTTIAYASLYFVVYFTVKDALDSKMINNVTSIAASISKTIENDLDRYLYFIETKDIYSDYYLEMNRHFAHLKEIGSLAYIYTVRLVCDNYLEFLLDGELKFSEYWSAPGELEEIDIGGIIAYSENRVVGLRDKSEWGDLIVGYAPIRNKDGEIISLVGVDISGDLLSSYLNKIQIILIFLYAILLIVVWIFAKQYSSSIVKSMSKDKLTGAYIKRYYESILKYCVKKMNRKDDKLFVMILDLDRFKNINDNYGHPFGDKVLTEVSKTIMGILRNRDYLIRYGGEEFVAIIQCDKDMRIEDVANRIRIAVSETKIYNEEHNKDISLTISIGISVYFPKGKSSDMIHQADKALYEAKKERNKVHRFIKG